MKVHQIEPHYVNKFKNGEKYMSEESKIEILEEKLDKHVTGYQVDRKVLIIAIPFLFTVVVGVIVFFGLNTSDAITKAVEKAAELQAIEKATQNAQKFERQASEAAGIAEKQKETAELEAGKIKKIQELYEGELKKITEIERQLSKLETVVLKARIELSGCSLVDNRKKTGTAPHVEENICNIGQVMTGIRQYTNPEKETYTDRIYCCSIKIIR